MKHVVLFSSICFLAIGCGDDGGVGGDPDAAEALACPALGAEPVDPGMICPTAVATAWTTTNGQPTEVGVADFSCLNTPTDDMTSTVEINLTGQIRDFQNGTAVADPSIEAFPGVDFNNVIGTATGDGNGDYAVTVPSGQTRVGFKVSATDYLDTYLLNQYFDPGTADQGLNIEAISVATADLIPALIGLQRTPGLGVLAAAIRDCNGDTVKDVIATVSGTSGAVDSLSGGQTYYFNGGLPTNHTVMQQTNTDGLFVSLELPASATAYMQVWGFVDGQDPATDDLTLIAELASPIVGDTVISVSLFPLRSN